MKNRGKKNKKMSHFCQYHPVDKTGGQNMYHILEGNDLQFYNFVRLCFVMRGSLARCLFLSPWLKSRRASLIEKITNFFLDRLSKKEKIK